MTPTLEDHLLTIDGVDERIAAEVLTVVAEHDSRSPYVERALRAASMNDFRSAGVYLQHVTEGDS